MDALVNELRHGTVKLRKNRRKTQTNPALQEMFAVLELTRNQNRSSKMLVDSSLAVSMDSFNDKF